MTHQKNKYPIGTTAVADVNNVKYFLMALSKTDIKSLKASATLHDLWDALAGLWQAIRNQSNGYTVCLPLIGSGASGVGLPTNILINQILTSLFYYTKKEKISDKIVIVLPVDMENKVDLIAIKRSWS